MLVECEPSSQLLFDPRVFAWIQDPTTFYALDLDPDFAALAPEISGKTPTKPWFPLPNGESRRIGWFVGFLDEKSQLPAPHMPSLLDSGGTDTRVYERSLPDIIATPFNLFGCGRRLIPFAALYDEVHPPVTLQWEDYDLDANDALCLDRSTAPQSVVLCGYDRAVDAVSDDSYQSGDTELRYNEFTTFVSNSFHTFVQSLSSEA